MHDLARERAERSVVVVAVLGLLYAALAVWIHAGRGRVEADTWPWSPVAGTTAPGAQAPASLDPVWSASEAIDAARVSLPSAPGGVCEPEPVQHRHRCSNRPWLWVGRHGALVSGAPTAGLWIHPAPNAERTTIRWDALALGARLRGRLGLERGAGNGGTVVVSAKVDDSNLGTWEVRDELVAETFDVEIPAGPAQGSLEFTVFALQDGRRLAVLDAVMVGTRASPAAEEAP